MSVVDALESDAIKKVIHGIPRPAGFYQGQSVMAPVYNPRTGRPKKDRKGELVMAPVMIREFPTALHSLLLKGWRPERHKDKVEHSGPGGKPLPAVGGHGAHGEVSETGNTVGVKVAPHRLSGYHVL